ncbi:rCG52314 [Rattus norvegicus]|uniref:RCG52314 n=1 Tax=Rattus norvegicus TaxID=10116 RepID=A6K0U5_RAT|nr:rCG52314 [Rattus norvegicus]
MGQRRHCPNIQSTCPDSHCKQTLFMMCCGGEALWQAQETKDDQHSGLHFKEQIFAGVKIVGQVSNHVAIPAPRLGRGELGYNIHSCSLGPETSSATETHWKLAVGKSYQGEIICDPREG